MGRQQQGILADRGPQVLGAALPNTYWEHLGLKTMTATRQRFNPTT